MPSHRHAEHTAVPLPDLGTIDALISQAQRLRGQVDAARQASRKDDEDTARRRWQRAMYNLAVHHLDDLGAHLVQLREGLRPGTVPGPAGGPGPELRPLTPEPPRSPYEEQITGRFTGRSGCAEWDLLTDRAMWSEEMFHLFGRSRRDGPLPLDELPSWLLTEDQRLLTSMVTACLVDGRPIDGEFRIVRPDGSMRTVHMVGEAVPDIDGATGSLWAVLRDVSALRRGQLTLRRPEGALPPRQRCAPARQPSTRPPVALPAPWHGAVRLAPGDLPGLDVAAHCPPAGADPTADGAWCDALHLSGGVNLLTVGHLSDAEAPLSSDMTMLLGAVRGMALAGLPPGPLLSTLDGFLHRSARSGLTAALCCRYDAGQRTLAWARTGHPAPLLFRDGAGRALELPQGPPPGTACDTMHDHRTERLRPGDLLVLHTAGPTTRGTEGNSTLLAHHLLRLSRRFAEAGSARDGVRTIIGERTAAERTAGTCLLVAKVT